MTIAGLLGNNPYYHPSNVKFKITHLHFTQCPLSPLQIASFLRVTQDIYLVLETNSWEIPHLPPLLCNDVINHEISAKVLILLNC